MSLNSIFANGVDGLLAQSQAIGSISDNIANLNTTAYKKSDTLFNTLLGETTSFGSSKATTSTPPTAPSNQNGVASFTRQLVTLDGAIHSTGNQFDLAITGPGMFVFANIAAAAGSTTFPGNNPTQSFVYGRAGDLQELVPTAATGAISAAAQAANSNVAFLTNKNGQFLMAIKATPPVPGQPVVAPTPPTSTAQLVPVQVSSSAPFPGQVTTTAALSAVIPTSANTGANAPLPAAAVAAGATSVTVTDPASYATGQLIQFANDTANFYQVTGVAGTTVSFALFQNGAQVPGGLQTAIPAAGTGVNKVGTTTVSTAVSYFDANGVKQPLTITWSNAVITNNPPATPFTTWNVSATDGNGNPVAGVAPATVSFDGQGKAIAPSTISITATSTVNTTPPTALPTTTFKLDMAGVQMLGTATTQKALATNTSLVQDGLPSGAFTGIKINPDGSIVGQYTGGASQLLYQIPIALFASPDNLQTLAGNVYAPTQGSGAPSFGLPGLATPGQPNGVAQLQIGAVEESNVDLGAEFSKMILTQQAYGASSQIVKVANEMSQTLVGL